MSENIPEEPMEILNMAVCSSSFHSLKNEDSSSRSEKFMWSGSSLPTTLTELPPLTTSLFHPSKDVMTSPQSSMSALISHSIWVFELNLGVLYEGCANQKEEGRTSERKSVMCHISRDFELRMMNQH